MATPTPPTNSGTSGVLGGLGISDAQIQQGIAAAVGGGGAITGDKRIVPTTPDQEAAQRQGFDFISPKLGAGPTLDRLAAAATRTAGDVKLDVQRMTDGDLAALGKRLVAAHLLPDDWDLAGGRDDIEKVWNTLVDRAASYHDANPSTNMSPQDMIDLYSGQSASGKNQGATTSTSTSYGTSMTADGARRMLSSMMTGALGRAPTAKETDDFQAALNAAQANNPTVTTSTSQVDASGNRSTTSHATGGFDAGDFASGYQQDNLAKTTEYKHYQAATTYYQAMLDAIRSPTNLVNVQ